MRLVIISDTPHHLGADGHVLGFGPAVREYDQLARLFDEVVHIAPCHEGTPPANASAYTSGRIRVRTIAPAGGDGFIAKLGVVRRIPRWVMVIRSELRSSDAVHVRCPANVCLIALLVLAARREPKLRWVQYAVDWSGTPGEAVSYRLQRWLLRHDACRAAVTVNGSWPHQARHVHTFDNPALTSEEVRSAKADAEHKRPPVPVRILFAGRLVPAKAPLRAIAVARRLRERGIDVRLELAGDGPERGACEQYVSEHGLHDHVTFHGWLDRAALDSLYAASHVFLLPSIGEGFPRAIAEAMAFGAVPVAGDCSCVRQVLDELGTGAAVVPNDVEAFVDTVVALVSPRRWPSQSAAAVAAAPRFTYARHLDALEVLLFRPAAPVRDSAGST